jgi:glycosyltransferase involved in cell wall biosynthesis
MRTSIVVPAYNEASRIESTLRAVLRACDGRDFEILVVDDGSTDETVSVAEAVLQQSHHGRVVRLERNQGKGAAVRAGVLGTDGDAIVYMDADLATDLSALDPAIDALADADVAVGTRVGPGASVRNSTRSRAVMARGFNWLARLSTRVDLVDTQCGFKAFRGDVGRELFGLSRSDGYAFDVEILLLARRLGLTTVEVPVRWTAVEGSSIRPFADSFQMALDLPRIAARWTPRRTRQATEARDVQVTPAVAPPRTTTCAPEPLQAAAGDGVGVAVTPSLRQDR